jgi:hypothetical protein
LIMRRVVALIYATVVAYFLYAPWNYVFLDSVIAESAGKPNKGSHFSAPVMAASAGFVD